jgi:hypothetical protein
MRKKEIVNSIKTICKEELTLLYHLYFAPDCIDDDEVEPIEIPHIETFINTHLEDYEEHKLHYLSDRYESMGGHLELIDTEEN